MEILEDTEGNLSTWRDPYEWVDPFAEAEEWALRWARERQRSDTTRLREAHAHEVRVLKSQRDALLRHFCEAKQPTVSVESLGLQVVQGELSAIRTDMLKGGQ